MKYDTIVYSPIRAFSFLLITYSSAWIIIFLTAHFLPNILSLQAAFICIVVIMIIPNIFFKQMKLLFTNRMVLNVGKEEIDATKYSSANRLIYDNKYLFNNLKSYRFILTSDKVAHIILYLKNGQRKDLAYKEEKTWDEIVGDNDSLLKIFVANVREYNAKNIEKITLEKSILNKKAGLLILILLIALFICAVVMTFTVSNKSSFVFLIIGLFSIIKIFQSKKSDLQNFDRLSHLM